MKQSVSRNWPVIYQLSNITWIRWYIPAKAWINHFYFKELIDVPGCTNKNACNYNPAATQDDGSCDTYSCVDHSHSVDISYKPNAGPVVAVVFGVISVSIVVGIILFLIFRSKQKRRRELSYVVEGQQDEQSDSVSTNPVQDSTSRCVYSVEILSLT